MTERSAEAISLSTSIYPERCLRAAATAFKDFCTVALSPGPDDALHASFSINPQHSSQAQRVIDQYLNYALDLSLREHLAISDR